MNKLKLTLLSLAGLSFPGHHTSNAASDDIAELKKQMTELQEQNIALQEKLESQRTIAASPVTGSSLNLGPFRLPEGIDEKDVIWRVAAGLDVKLAVEAAIAQKKHDDAVAETLKKAKK